MRIGGHAKLNEFHLRDQRKFYDTPWTASRFFDQETLVRTKMIVARYRCRSRNAGHCSNYPHAICERCKIFIYMAHF
jgi:hypothetical protein